MAIGEQGYLLSGGSVTQTVDVVGSLDAEILVNYQTAAEVLQEGKMD